MIEETYTDWFVAQLRPQGLSRAVTHLERQEFETFAPMFNASTLRGGIRHAARKPLFPGYIFVRFDPNRTGWTAINSTRGVARLVLNDPRKPVHLPPALMAGLMARCDANGVLLPPEELAIGDKIRVLAGPFAELVTTIESLPDQERISVLIDLMGRKVRTSFPRSQIARLG
ncbi:transcription termination/antitermination protein NusG [Marimonas sp. MJW-29]|uniref:Transcription termination/antitermination protein NusG n=1 Tax=Sulfitobacter sediminis TaxID=3234186 RepID=A0ABV3RUI8_9RHOB